ncbi:MAG TPA: dihydropteroate synthase [Alphaproteobacteria bacterium]|jgi:dihydropteroate synthase|nr:dihydropteroate synthase [Alphaproteobacteria bacterium]
MSEFAATPGAVAAFVDRLRLPEGGLYVRPAALVSGPEARAVVAGGRGMRLAGGDLAFLLCELIARADDGGRASIVAPADCLFDWCREARGPLAHRVRDRFAALTRPRAPFAGVPLAAGCGAKVAIMGIVNVTPDSFSDGGRHLDVNAAIAHGAAMLEAGAQIIDIGGESTRPGAVPVPVDEELRRVLPVVRGLAKMGATVSIDTRHAAVMAAAVSAGARIINDVTALSGDRESLGVAAKSGAGVALMHMQGEPATMQDDPSYDDAPLDVYDFLEARIAACEQAGLSRASIVIDPGIGFGKTKQHNAEILSGLALYHGLGCGILVGVSRKGFVAGASGGEPADKRLAGSLAAALDAVEQGAQLLRVHDVAETRQALAVRDAVHPPAGWTAEGGGE